MRLHPGDKSVIRRTRQVSSCGDSAREEETNESRTEHRKAPGHARLVVPKHENTLATASTKESTYHTDHRKESRLKRVEKETSQKQKSFFFFFHRKVKVAKRERA